MAAVTQTLDFVKPMQMDGFLGGQMNFYAHACLSACTNILKTKSE